MDITAGSSGAQAQEPSIDRDRAQNFLRSVLAYADDESGHAILFGAGEVAAPQTLRVSSSFSDEDVAQVLAWNSATEQRNVYWGAATMSLDLPPQSRGKTEDIVAVHAIVVDLDDPTAAARYERSEFPLGLIPTYVIRTSSTPSARYQLVYRLDEPCMDLDAWRAAARCLQYAWGADNCTSDPTHVWRVPGTINWPNAKKRQAGRIAEVSTLVDANPEQDFALSDFEELPEPPEPPTASPANVLPFIRHNASEDWRSFGAMLTHLPSWMQIAMLEADQLPNAANGQPIDRSGFEWQIACEAATVGLTEGDYAAMFQLGHGYAFADKWRERESKRPGLGDEWARKTYQKAAAQIMSRGERIPAPPVERGEGQTPVVGGLAQPQPNEPQLPVLNIVRPARWVGKTPPERRFVVQNRIPEGYTTGLFGDGGLGKSLLVQQLATARASGNRWLGLETTPGRTLGLFCEDDEGELQRRQDALNDHFGITNGDLEGAFYLPRVADDNALMTFDKNGHGHLTPFWRALVEAALDHRADLVMIDTAADTFDGNELVKREVRQFITRACTGLARQLGPNGAVLLLSHPSQAGMESGRGDGANRAWNNSVRSRLYLTRAQAREGEPEDPDARILATKKANYARSGEELPIKYENGVFVPDVHVGTDTVDRIAHQAAFMEGLSELLRQGRPVSYSKNASNYAPKMIAALPHVKRISQAQLKQAMEALFAQGKIRSEQSGPPSRRTYHIMPTS